MHKDANKIKSANQKEANLPKPDTQGGDDDAIASYRERRQKAKRKKEIRDAELRKVMEEKQVHPH
jgi:hypothetical protein